MKFNCLCTVARFEDQDTALALSLTPTRHSASRCAKGTTLLHHSEHIPANEFRQALHAVSTFLQMNVNTQSPIAEHVTHFPPSTVVHTFPFLKPRLSSPRYPLRAYPSASCQQRAFTQISTASLHVVSKNRNASLSMFNFQVLQTLLNSVLTFRSHDSHHHFELTLTRFRFNFILPRFTFQFHVSMSHFSVS